MEQINYQEEYKRLFSAYLANPEIANASELESVKILIDKFPFCQPLHFIYAAGSKNDPEKFDICLSKAAILSPQRETLYQTIHHPEKFILKEDYVSDLKNGAFIKEKLVEEIIPDLVDLSEINIVPEEDIKSSADKISLKDFNNQNIRQVAKYDDDKLPYTFLWWLNKTRKEHSETYQPYVNFKLDTTRPIRRNVSDELNQQIIENIFHLEPALGDEEIKAPSKTVEFELRRKEVGIIEKFIKEDPQIRPMQPEKISTENKARKSAEDLYDMVSETLARIYTDQMLFHKAIDTYKKLSLKFPEKNAYFADQISELEKKIN